MTLLRPSPRVAAAVAAALMAGVLSAGSASAGPRAHTASAQTPIKHVIVIVGENHTFDNVFATYQAAARPDGQHLLSEGIVRANGDPGAERRAARQWTATDTIGHGYSTDPSRSRRTRRCRSRTRRTSTPLRRRQAMNAPDSRFPANLPNAPFQITKYVPYDEIHSAFKACDNGAYVGDPLHRFYQMNQQADHNQNKLWCGPRTPPATRTARRPTGTTDQGALSMGFYNVHQATPRCSTTWPTTSRCPTTTTRRSWAARARTTSPSAPAPARRTRIRTAIRSRRRPTRSRTQCPGRVRTTSTPRTATRAARTPTAPTHPSPASRSPHVPARVVAGGGLGLRPEHVLHAE